ncbi:hypothetical protein HMPREF0043_02258 [Actinobaculum sp. oral taxon 183 str. F0552]|nr:hypothetical protein HMPREF0043_02258 [Actinobaculum sp. oral taxon 183 str. F0552]
MGGPERLGRVNARERMMRRRRRAGERVRVRPQRSGPEPGEYTTSAKLW